MRRRDAHRLALGGTVGLTRAAAERPRPAHAQSAPPESPESPEPPERTVADAFGMNESFRAPSLGALSGAGWTRWTVQWFNMQLGPERFNQFYFLDADNHNLLEAQAAAGIKSSAVVIGTPEWAAEVPGLKTGTSVPCGLREPFFVDDAPNPDNPWGWFMYELARRTQGLIDVFEIWNEVEIPASGSNAIYNTWAGTPADYYQLLKVAAEAVRAANPTARVFTWPYSYFKDKENGRGSRLPFFEGFADAVRADPAGASVFDGFALNLYRNPHDLWDRMHGGAPQLLEAADRKGFRQRLQELGAGDKPIWLTEINAMPYDDAVPGWDPAARNDGFRITMDEQASYVLQAYALALCAGYDKVFFQALQDDPYPVPDELWGLVRFSSDPQDPDPGRMRPAFTAYQLAARYLGNADWCRLYVRTRPDTGGYRRYASRYDWAAHLAVFQKGTRRATVLWNGTGAALPVALQAFGSAARVVDKYGGEAALPRDRSGRLTLTLEAARRHFNLFGGDPPGYYYVGGSPVIVVEADVPPDAPVQAAGFQPA